MGNDYFCESGIKEPYNDMTPSGMERTVSPVVLHILSSNYIPTSTTDDIEARICVDDGIIFANIAVELVVLYVQ